ncbi:hypothetical protein GQ44DRAFT_568299, partial [Phaeosphaeriaceae sp. PMI808]
STTPRELPSFLSYVDHEIMRSSARHNCPPHPDAICPICCTPWNTTIKDLSNPNPFEDPPIIATTFLPLSPCGHWVHYRCLIWLATQNDDRRSRCYVCHTPLFQWEGITALTLAVRTGLDMDDGGESVLQRLGSRRPEHSDKAEYEAECAFTESLIHKQFFVHLNMSSRYEDNSPNLVQCFYDVLGDLARFSRPQARWLQFSTPTGLELFAMLVMIKMRRYLTDEHSKIVQTAGWRDLEE